MNDSDSEGGWILTMGKTQEGTKFTNLQSWLGKQLLEAGLKTGGLVASLFK